MYEIYFYLFLFNYFTYFLLFWTFFSHRWHTQAWYCEYMCVNYMLVWLTEMNLPKVVLSLCAIRLFMFRFVYMCGYLQYCVTGLCLGNSVYILLFLQNHVCCLLYTLYLFLTGEMFETVLRKNPEWSWHFVWLIFLYVCMTDVEIMLCTTTYT